MRQYLIQFNCDSDFVWEFTATDNTLSFTNNNSAGFGLLGFNYAYKNEDNGPFTLNSPSGNFEPNSGEFFNHDYICANDVPTQINLDWGTEMMMLQITAFLVLMMVKQACKVFQWQCLLLLDSKLHLYCYSTDNGCPQNYEINLQVERAPLTVTYFADNICDADLITLDNTYIKDGVLHP